MMNISRVYARGVYKLRYVILVVWLLALGLGAWKAFGFIGETNFTFDPPTDSDAVKALEALMTYFPGDGGYKTFIVLLTSNTGQPLSNTSVLGFSSALESQYGNYYCRCFTPLSFLSASSLTELGLSAVAQQFITPSLTSTFIMIQWLGCGCDDAEYGQFLQNIVTPLAGQYFPNGNTTVSVTGESILDKAVEDGVESDMLLCDGISFPLALLIFCLTLQSLRLLIIPVLNITISLLTSFLIMYPIAQHKNVVSFAPSLMLSTTIAMSIDYSLFLLSRFREEVRLRRSQQDAIELMIRSSGHTVLVSGLTLALCFAGLLLFPMELLSSLGLGCSIAVGVAVTVNLTLTPALLNIFPNFFRNIIKPFRLPKCLRRKRSDETRGHDTLLGIHEESDADSGEDEVPLVKQRDDDSSSPLDSWEASVNHHSSSGTRVTKSKWYKFGQFVVKHPLIILILSLGLVAYPSYVGVRFKWSLSSLDYAPRGSTGFEPFADMNNIFGAGKVFPYQILLALPPQPNVSVLTPAFFEFAHNFIGSQLLPQSPAGTVVFSAVWYPDVTYDDIAACVARYANCSKSASLLASHYINNPGQIPGTTAPTAVFLDLFLGVDPASYDGITWIESTRSLLAGLRSQGVSASLAGGMTYSYDAVQVVYDAFPTALGVTTAVVFAVVGLAFRSFLIPLRSVLTIAMTLGLVYGLATFVYQYNILNFLTLGGVHGNGALFWIPPVLSFSILVGLGLDYDIFLLTRIVEYRRQGLSDRGSILLGLARTGRIITAAGGIMAVAFFGLLFSKIGLLNQMSFLLVFAVLIDTLFIRTMVVPAIMTLLGRANWFPLRMPQPEPDALTHY
eukprot:m.237109 g.237109  ORF g.237109 m.237109 type:complete len:844 (-) comp20941_c0_seq1:46-2577(-)